MKRLILVFVCLLGISKLALAQSVSKAGEFEDFRRSSLCLLLITSQGDEYAKAIQEQFMNIPMPARYNGLNVNVRVLNVGGKATEKRITRTLKNNEVAKELVGKWFNRDSQGRMNMDRIHAWGGYNAAFADLKRAENSVRGTAMLADEGVELIRNTFVMVCDISYYDRKQTGVFLAALAQGLGSVAMGTTENKQLKESIADLTNTVSTASLDMAGFSVNVKSHLYRLKWDENLLDKVYRDYWVDESTSATEASQRRAAFDSDKSSFGLEYLGCYRSRAGRTVSGSATPDLKQVVREVCSNAVNKSVNNLAKMFPVFKAKTPFYCENGNVYAYIGTKEGVSQKSKFEVIESEKTEKGIKYNRVATFKPARGQVWDNQNMLISDDGLQEKYKGTQFVWASGKRDICNQGLMMREKGRLGYQYKRHNFYVGAHLGVCSIDESDFRDDVSIPSSAYNIRVEQSSGFVGGFDCGHVWNMHSNIAWNTINMTMLAGGVLSLAGTTGIILRTNPLGKKGRWSFFVWPTIGASFASADAEVSYTSTTSHSRYDKTLHKYITTTSTSHGTRKAHYSDGGFDWGVKAGVNINEHFMICFNKTTYHIGGTVGVLF